MASLSSLAITGTLKLLDPELRKQPSTASLTQNQKCRSISVQKVQTSTRVGGNFNKGYLEFREAVSVTEENEEVERLFYRQLLDKCMGCCSVSQAQAVHGHMIKTGTHEDVVVMCYILEVYAMFGAMETAHKVFDCMPRRNAVQWTALMVGYVRNAQPERSAQLFRQMLDSGSYPTIYTLSIALNASSSMNSASLAHQVHAYTIKYHVDFDVSIGNTLCSLYSRYGNLKGALNAFGKIEDKDVISWTAAISACGENGRPILGLQHFIQMLQEEDVKPNEVTLSSVTSLCCDVLLLNLGTQVHALSIKLGCNSNLRFRNSLLYLYLICGYVNEPEKLFDEMDNVSLVTWNALIAGHAQMMSLSKDEVEAYKSGNKALSLFLKIKRSGMKPDGFTFSSILSVCSKLTALQQGEQIHAQAMKTGILSDVVVGTALINMYSKCGSIEKASKTFVERRTRTLISWTTMIAGYAQHGLSQQALQLFDDMRMAGVRPNQITFVAVLSACSRAGMVNEALNYFHMMQKDYRIKPVMDHYACLIGMFVRLGRLDEAFDFVKKMNFEPNEFIWGNLVAGCWSHGKLEQGFYAAEQLLNLRPKDIETYVLLLNMYLSSGQFKDVSRVRKMMKEEKAGMLIDWSWISIKEKVYSFKPNGKAHPQSSEIYELLEDLLTRAKNIGYEPEEIPEITDEEETVKPYSSIRYHSEKLAVAFGLISLPNSAPVSVIKNTIMCRDCHNFIKTVSLLTGREIVVRDSRRLHKFVNGQCSCGDFGSTLILV